MKRSRVVTLLFLGTVGLGGCGSPAQRPVAVNPNVPTQAEYAGDQPVGAYGSTYSQSSSSRNSYYSGARGIHVGPIGRSSSWSSPTRTFSSESSAPDRTHSGDSSARSTGGVGVIGGRNYSSSTPSTHTSTPSSHSSTPSISSGSSTHSSSSSSSSISRGGFGSSGSHASS